MIIIISRPIKCFLIRSGQWLANQKNGEGVFVHPDGKIFVGDFERDRILSHEGCTARATEDVNVQTRLNIGDIILRFPEARVEPTLSPLTKNKPPSSIPTVPPAFSSSVLTDADEADPFLTQTKEIERLLLRYNSITRSYYRQTAELANRKRMREINLISISDPDTNNWPKVEQAMFQARNFSKRLFGMTLDQVQAPLPTQCIKSTTVACYLSFHSPFFEFNTVD